MKPGDVVLFAPDSISSRLNTFAQALISEHVLVDKPVSHSLVFIGRDARGRGLFLDNTLREGERNGTRVIGETEFVQTYGNRKGWVAQPIQSKDGAAIRAHLDEKELLRIGIRASRRYDQDDSLYGYIHSDYGIFGKDMVCSETAGMAVLRTMGVPYQQNRFGFPFEIIPADFLDPQDPTGRWFDVTPLARP